jgi:hypothetical protein
MEFHMRATALLVLLVLTTQLQAEDPPKPPQPTEAQAKQLVVEGDRLAEQADYSGALERYTEAYHAIVSRIRGQKFTSRVLPNLLTRTELGQEMLRMMQQEYTPDEFALMDASYKAFGLMPAEMNSQELLTKLLTEEVAGFYDPDKKRMVLIREDSNNKDPGFFGKLFGAKPAFDKAEQKTTLAHEMTHALQDQLYGLKAMQERIEKDDDMLLAFSALVEGDATLLMFAEMNEDGDITQLDPEVMRTTFSLMSFMLPVAGGATYRKAPAIFRESLIFPYFQGMLFCLSMAGESGWPAVHAAYTSPPTSTEQVMHPEKYTTENRDEPQRVIIPNLEAQIPSAWKHLGGNCLGEFQTSILLRKLRSGRRAAAGWDGDRYEIYQHSDGKLGLVFVSTWDSEKDAAEFAKSYTEYRRPPKSKPDDAKSSDEAGSEAESKADLIDADQSMIEQHGAQVWIIEGFSTDIVKAVKPLLMECKYEPKPFPTE